MKYQVFTFFLFFHLLSFGQSTISIDREGVTLKEATEEFIFSPNMQNIRKKLTAAPRAYDTSSQWVKMKIPFADGTYHTIEVAESAVVADKIYKQYPENRSYKVRGVKNKFISGRMSITPLGMTAMIYNKSGNIFIEPTQEGFHKSYNYDSSVLKSFSCGADHSNIKKHEHNSLRASFGGNERKFIIAIASTGEFSAKHNNNLSTINAKITEYLTLLNTIYERDLAITFELTADNDDIIFFNPSTDGLDPTNGNTQLNSSQSVINSGIGSSNYDIGHTFYEIDPPGGGIYTGAGIAGLGVACASSFKGRGWSGCGGPYNNSFWMGIFAHEVGHQLAATHTFYGTAANCGFGQRSVGNGVEPGSGNSLMSYEGSCFDYNGCESQNITPTSNFYYFHGHSIDQIQSFVSSSGSCYTSTSTGNSPPSITMPSSKTIPKETPFYLSATVTDPDGDPLLLSWEEVDTDNLSLSCPDGAPNDAATSTTAPLFRSFDPSPGGNLRYFPQMSDILNNTQTMGEILPEVGRTIDMRMTARGIDANGISGVSYEDVTITVDGNSGPFEILTANTPTGYQPGESTNIEWTVGNTNIAPISCTNVNILFSNNGGESFPITLAANTPNDGNQNVTMPLSGTEAGRIKIEPVDNIFFTINKADIVIISDCEPNSSSIINDDNVVANVGSPSLNLGLIFGEEISSISGTLTASDPSSTLIAEAASGGSCSTVPSSEYYDTYKFVASESDTYTFTISNNNFFSVINIYEDEYIIPVINCTNWLASNAVYNPPNISSTNSTSVTLSENDIIELVVSGLYLENTENYTISFSSNGSGVLNGSDIIPVGYTYKFAIYNSSGFIIDIVDEADLTDGTLYYDDTYTVRGLMILTAADESSYINQPFTTLQSDLNTGIICGELSTNDVSVTINGCTAGVKVVTSTLDNGNPGTLRYKMSNVCPGDMIQFDPSLSNATILINSEIIVDDNFSVAGLGANALTFSGNNASRIFNINSGVTLSLSGMTLIDGYSASNGGAFINNGDLQLENINFVGNKSGLNSKAFTNLGNITISSSVNVED